jgi:predicted ATPase
VRVLPSGTVTFLFTDIEGSTRLLHEHGDAYAKLLAQHRRTLRDAFVRHAGVEVDTQGDAFFAAFARPEDAVAVAAEAQRELELPVRMGIHTGEPELADEGYVGLDVHRAARICAAGHGGQVVLSKATADLINDALRDLGEHRLKDFDDPVWLYQLGERSFPPLRTISNTNLPRPASSFVGREREVHEVASLLHDGARMLTLTGPGGSGKTRLALEAAAELVPVHRGGVFWVGLAPLRDSALVLETIAQTLGATVTLAEHIGEHEMLLVLDNLEQLVEAAPGLADLVEACSNLKLLVTSRELLRVRGEVEYPVPPLVARDGVALFVDRSRAQGVVVDANGLVGELCNRLDNLPLALELAAARTKLFSPAQLLDRLGERLDLLKGGRDAHARQRTLRATIEWSHDLLTQDERALFARLSVFAGGCTFTAAKEICDADEEVLQALLDKSLLRRGDGPDGEPRFWMLETIRQFAVERLSGEAANDEFLRRHAEWYVCLGDEVMNPVVATDAYVARVARELDNFRSALDWSPEHEPRVGMRIVWILAYFWHTRGLASEGLRWAHWAMAEAGKLSPEDRVYGLLGAAELIRHFEDAEAGLRLKREALPILRKLGDDSELAVTLVDLAVMTAELGDFREARRLGDEAVALQRRAGLPGWIAHALHERGAVEFRAGAFALARSFYEEAHVFAEESGDPFPLANSVVMVAECARRVGAVAEARAQLRRGLTAVVDLGMRRFFPELLQEAAALAEPRDAATFLSAAERLEEEMGTVRWDPGDCEQTLAATRRALQPGLFDAAWEEGRSLSEEDVLALALRSLD